MAKQPQSKVRTGKSTDESVHKLLDVAAKLRASGKFPHLNELVSSVREAGTRLGWDAVYAVSLLQGTHAPLVIPPFISRFLNAYAGAKDYKTVLDPWAGVGSLLLPMIQGAKFEKAVGLVRSQEEIDLARLMDEASRADLLLGDPGALVTTLGDFDLVVSSPPFGLRAVSDTFESGAGKIAVNDSETFVLALRASLHLTENGEAIFIFPNSFFFRSGGTTVRETLSKVDLFVNAIIALPAGTFSPHTSIESNLVFISRRATPDVFVGHLGSEQDPAQLLKNLEKRSPGPIPDLGRLMPLESFKSWHALVAEEEVDRLAKRSGLSLVRLSELVESVNLGNRSEDGGFADLPNSVYLPLIGTAPAVTALSDFKLKPHNYVQLVVRPDKAYAEFLAGFINSPLGRKTRDALLRGAFIPKITKQSLLSATVYCAPLEIQGKAIDAQREIDELQLRLGQLHRELWHRPVDAANVRRDVTALTQKPSIESWLETLPFPLASVLWRYQATTNVEHKNVHLFNFFEAAAQFFGALMASAFHSNAQFFQARKREWFESGTDNPHSLARSNFGEWVVRCQRLAKTTRQMLSNEEERQICLDLYKTSDIPQVEAIANKALYAILEKIGRYRNDWKGHTGIVSTREHARRLTLLQEELTRFWSVLGPAFEHWWLIQPGANHYTGGIYHYGAVKLMGSRQIFKQIEVETTTVMDSNELYFFDPATRQPLPVLHFVRMMASPETEEIACYFYNRVEKEGVRWVSYHFESKAERVESDPSILKVIREVEENGA